MKRCSVPSVPVRGSAELKLKKMKDFGPETTKSDSKKVVMLDKSSWEWGWWVLGGQNRCSHWYSQYVWVLKRPMRCYNAVQTPPV